MVAGPHDATRRSSARPRPARSSATQTDAVPPKRSCSHLVYLIRELARSLAHHLVELSGKGSLQATQVAALRASHAALSTLWNEVLPNAAAAHAQPFQSTARQHARDDPPPCWHGIHCWRHSCPYWHPPGRPGHLTLGADRNWMSFAGAWEPVSPTCHSALLHSGGAPPAVDYADCSSPAAPPGTDSAERASRVCDVVDCGADT